MHELAICQALMEQVERIAEEERADQVLSIHLAIGPLSGVESRLLEQAFSVARANRPRPDSISLSPLKKII